MKKLLIPLFLALAGPAASAATLVTYNFSALTGTRNDWGNLSSAYAAPSAWTGDPRTGNYLLSGSTEATVTTGVVAGNILAAGVNLAYSTASPAVGALTDGDLDLANWVSSSTVAGQANVSGYITFTLTAAAGYNVTLNSLTFTGWRNGSGAPDSINFDYSIDGGTNWLDYSTAVVRSATGSASSASNTFTQTLTINEGSSVLFRFAPYKSDTTSASGSNTGNWHITGLSLDGAVAAVPEPSVALLGAVGLLGLLRRRR
ncbi:MAG: hypothetical protein QM755_07625 [Luteolibacter sp.]